MLSYEIRKSHLMPADAAAYRPFFFHTRDFVLRNGEVDATYTLIIHMDGEVFVRVHIALKGSEAISLPHSSFGGFDIHPDCSEADLKYAIEALQAFCSGKNIHRIRIIMYPECYDSYSASLISNALNNAGAQLQYTDETQYLDISREPFDALIRSDERRHLNFARKEQWSFWQEPANMLSDAYDLIVKSREHKNYPVTMTLDALNQAFSQFPDRYYLFSMRDEDGQMLAASIAIHVNEQVLYDFYHGDDPENRKHSTVVPLIEGLYNFARTHGYALLDLGTSTEKGIRNKPLFKFKKYLGAAVSPKRTYVIPA